MSFSDISGDLANRLRKNREPENGGHDKPVDYQELIGLRARILGVLIRDARQARDFSIEDCAAKLGVDVQTFTNWEYGQEHPSLPQLEVLAYELGVPISHFWGTETMTGNEASHHLPVGEYVALRDRVVGALLRKARTDAELSVEALSEKTGISSQKIEAYEVGQAAVPLAELTSLASAVNVSLRYFMENNNRIGHWLQLNESFQQFSQMPEQMRDFISNPTNSSFVELAMWFSELGASDLRGIAESILNLNRLDPNKMKQIAESILNDITL